MINTYEAGIIFWIICGIISAIISKVQSRDPCIEDMPFKWYLLFLILGPAGFLVNFMCMRKK